MQADRADRNAFWAGYISDKSAEWINGQAVTHGPRPMMHGYAATQLIKALSHQRDIKPTGDFMQGKCLVPFDLNDYEPDLIFYLANKLKQIKPETLYFPIPDFIVEILSESTKRNDRGIKMLDYASHGVGEYWIVDPDTRSAE